MVDIVAVDIYLNVDIIQMFHSRVQMKHSRMVHAEIPSYFVIYLVVVHVVIMLIPIYVSLQK